MELTVLNWFKTFLLGVVSKTIEVLFRIILLILPMGLYMLILQSREKASSASSLQVYTNDSSTWQHVFPGFILVSIDHKSLSNFIRDKVHAVQEWLRDYKYVLVAVFCVMLLVLIGAGFAHVVLK